MSRWPDKTAIPQTGKCRIVPRRRLGRVYPELDRLSDLQGLGLASINLWMCMIGIASPDIVIYTK